MKTITSESKLAIQGDASMSPRTRSTASRAHAQTDPSKRSVKQVAEELGSVLLDTLGLAAAIEWHLHEFRKCTRIPCELTIKDTVGPGLPERYATVIFHIYHEALSNVARHAAANRVAIDVSIMPDEVTMEIRDDGIGIAAEQACNSRPGGLAEICRRADAYNGRCRISGMPNRGTTLSVCLPLAAEAC